MRPVIGEMYRLGGSHAQQDVLEQVFLRFRGEGGFDSGYWPDDRARGRPSSRKARPASRLCHGRLTLDVRVAASDTPQMHRCAGRAGRSCVLYFLHLEAVTSPAGPHRGAGGTSCRASRRSLIGHQRNRRPARAGDASVKPAARSRRSRGAVDLQVCRPRALRQSACPVGSIQRIDPSHCLDRQDEPWPARGGCGRAMAGCRCVWAPMIVGAGRQVQTRALSRPYRRWRRPWLRQPALHRIFTNCPRRSPLGVINDVQRGMAPRWNSRRLWMHGVQM